MSAAISLLQTIVDHKKSELQERRKRQNTLIPYEGPPRPSFLEALKAPISPKQPHLILEIKPKSPSAGVLDAAPDLHTILHHYTPVASALSVLTDERFFGGSLDLLRQVAQQTPRPLLLKDFVLDPMQLEEAVQVGASAALLIVKILDTPQLTDLMATATALNLTPVIEVQNQGELDKALALSPQPPILLINNRNLDTLTIDFETTQTLAPQLPSEIVTVSASGIKGPADLKALWPYAQRFLIGTALMEHPKDQWHEKLHGLKHPFLDKGLPHG